MTNIGSFCCYEVKEKNKQNTAANSKKQVVGWNTTDKKQTHHYHADTIKLTFSIQCFKYASSTNLYNIFFMKISSYSFISFIRLGKKKNPRTQQSNKKKKNYLINLHYGKMFPSLSLVTYSKSTLCSIFVQCNRFFFSSPSSTHEREHCYFYFSVLEI